METLVDLPEIEYLDGVAYPKVSSKTTHSAVQGAILRALDACGGKTGMIGPELRCQIGAVDDTKTEFVPDAAYVDWSRLLALPRDQRDEPPFSPDVVVEVRSPSDRTRFRTEKIARYLATGAKLVLDVDPKTRRIETHTAGAVREYVAGEQFVNAAAPWLTFTVDEIFADLDLLES